MNQINTKTRYILISILFCIVFTGLFIVLSFTKSFIPEKLERFAHGTIGTIVALLTTYLFLRFNRTSFADIGLQFGRTTLVHFFTGFAIGIGIMGLMTGSVIYFSGFKIEVNNNSNILYFLLGTLPLVPLAFTEEIAFRGYPLAVLKKNTSIHTSIIITSILFALYHVANGWTITNSFLGAGVWGIIFGLAAIHSNGISMPTGLHYAANLTTSAFAVTDNSFNIWVLKQENGLTAENYQASQLETLIPQVSLLVLAIICMKWVLRNKTGIRKDVY